MNKNFLPAISIVIAVFNEEKNIGYCLKSIQQQIYPQEKIEIIIVDDNSTDNTVKIARKYTNKIYYSGKHILDCSKALGINKAIHEYILFMDADNILGDRKFLSRLIKPFRKEKQLIGSYPFRFMYCQTDPPANRYCSLFGINDPYQIYTNSSEHLSYRSCAWHISGNAVERDDYFLITYPRPARITLGAIGFMTRKSFIIPYINNGYFFHSDVFNDLIRRGKNKFVAVKTTIIHNHCKSSLQFFKKLSRNYENYLKFNHLRSTGWATDNFKRLVTATIIMITFIIPKGVLEKA